MIGGGCAGKIGYMPDFFGVYDDMLVWEYLDFFGRCYGLPTDRRLQVIGDLLELVDLADKRDAYVQTLSRVACGSVCAWPHALVHDPKVLAVSTSRPPGSIRAPAWRCASCCASWAPWAKTVVVSSHILSELAEPVRFGGHHRGRAAGWPAAHSTRSRGAHGRGESCV